MLNALIQSKTRLKLLLRFFLNPESTAYLRGLAEEFDENTNSVRIELNRFEEAGLLSASKQGNKKIFRVNPEFPMFSELQKIAMRHFGIDQIVDQIIHKLGDLDAVYLTGDLARGLDTPIVDLTLIGKEVDTIYLARLVEKAEGLIDKKIRTVVYQNGDKAVIEEPKLLIFGQNNFVNG